MDDFQNEFAKLVAQFSPTVETPAEQSQFQAFFAKTVGDLGMDSLDTMELIMNIEDHFEITLDEDLVLGAQSVADLGALVEDQIKRR